MIALAQQKSRPTVADEPSEDAIADHIGALGPGGKPRPAGASYEPSVLSTRAGRSRVGPTHKQRRRIATPGHRAGKGPSLAAMPPPSKLYGNGAQVPCRRTIARTPTLLHPSRRWPN